MSWLSGRALLCASRSGPLLAAVFFVSALTAFFTTDALFGYSSQLGHTGWWIVLSCKAISHPGVTMTIVGIVSTFFLSMLSIPFLLTQTDHGRFGAHFKVSVVLVLLAFCLYYVAVTITSTDSAPLVCGLL